MSPLQFYFQEKAHCEDISFSFIQYFNITFEWSINADGSKKFKTTKFVEANAKKVCKQHSKAHGAKGINEIEGFSRSSKTQHLTIRFWKAKKKQLKTSKCIRKIVISLHKEKHFLYNRKNAEFFLFFYHPSMPKIFQTAHLRQTLYELCR